jgi:general secretion pathway protein D
MVLLALPALGQETPQDEEKVKVSFFAIELEALAQQVERVTKRSFVFQEQILKGRKVTLQSERPITPDEFYRVFQSVCLMNGFALVPAPEPNINLVKIVPASQAAKEPGAQPVLTRGEPVPLGEGVIYYVFTPKHLSAARTVPIITTALSPTGVATQVPNSELVLIIDAAAAVQRTEKLLGLFDVPGEPATLLAVPLQHVAASIAKLQVMEFYQAREKITTGETGRVRLEALSDERLNQLLLIGHAEEVQRAEAFLKQVDRELPSVKRTIAYYRIKNVPVDEVANYVSQFLGVSGSRRASDRRIAPVSGASSVVKPVADEKIATQEGPSIPSAIQIIPLGSQNMLVVVANQATHDAIRGILEQLDKRRSQVLIEVAIIQVTGDDSLDMGVEALLEDRKGTGATLNGGSGFGLSTQADPAGGGFPTVQNLATFSGGAMRYLKPDDISVLIRAVSAKAHVNILSQPLLLVNDNEDANFTTKVSEPTVVTSQGTTTTQTSFAGFADATTSLTITPQISPDGYINLRITQSFEEFTGGSSTAGVPPPKVSNNVSTMITVPDRYTAILGGFTRDSATDSKTGIPVLMNVPVLEWFTSHTTTRLTKSRLYLFVRPRILSAEGFGDLKHASQEKADGVRQFLRDPRMQSEVRGAIPSDNKGIREAPLPFDRK